jgi:chorismate mutase
MAPKTISIPLDAETAKAYDAARPEERRKMEALASVWLRELATADPATLAQVLNDVSRKARERGLTPELLESILKDA